jgi:hypothetical protein
MHRTFQAIIPRTKGAATTGNPMQLSQSSPRFGNGKKKGSKKE